MRFNLKKSVVLIGMMGAGKSAIGSRLANKIDITFIDIDSAIEEKEGKSVSEIFAELGGGYFRKLEYDTISELLSREDKYIIATGGGAFCQDNVKKEIKEKGLSVWLKADFEVLLERVSRKNTRPLLEKGNKEEILKELIAKREPYYNEADIIVKSDTGPHNRVVDTIIYHLKPYAD